MHLHVPLLFYQVQRTLRVHRTGYYLPNRFQIQEDRSKTFA
jgi:hypothetical protein